MDNSLFIHLLVVFKSRHGGTLHENPRFQPQLLKHGRAFAFSAYGRKFKPPAMRVDVDPGVKGAEDGACCSYCYDRYRYLCHINVYVFGWKALIGQISRCEKKLIGDKKMKDNGGRRLISDRRKCTNFDHFPERRTRRFRRSDLDRRKGWAVNSRVGIERRTAFR